MKQYSFGKGVIQLEDNSGWGDSCTGVRWNDFSGWGDGSGDGSGDENCTGKDWGDGSGNSTFYISNLKLYDSE